jgi:hypothetical protein
VRGPARGRRAAALTTRRRRPTHVAGIVFVEVPAPFWNPPREIVEETDPDNPANVEKRDYLQVEKDAWNARKRIGDIPVDG